MLLIFYKNTFLVTLNKNSNKKITVNAADFLQTI